MVPALETLSMRVVQFPEVLVIQAAAQALQPLLPLIKM
jgi:hypothetical protein